MQHEKRIQLACSRIQGYYHLQAARASGEYVIKAAKISARARYFHGVAALVGAMGILGGFGYKIYEETGKLHQETTKTQKMIQKQEETILELLEAYTQLADLQMKSNKMEAWKETTTRAKKAERGLTKQHK